MNSNRKAVQDRMYTLLFKKMGFQRNIIPALFILLLLLVLLFSLSTENFFTISNAKSILSNISVKAIMAIGLTFVFLIGGMDLSIGSQLGFTVICALLFSHMGIPF
ncbi:MAG: hypothetical protein K9L24_03275, partial [Spirochaetia bacterium]|nr:hypothetical protein [Spirochaetia bacterium]